jgi:fatty acid desaturase
MPAKRLNAADYDRLTKTSDADGLFQLIGHACFILATGFVVYWSRGGPFVVRALACLVHGIGLTHLYMPFHESSHYTAFRSRPLCEAVAWVTGALALLNSTDFRFFHKQHHIHTNVPDKDPEMPGASVSLRGYCFKLMGGEMLIAQYFVLQIFITGKVGAPWCPPESHTDIVRSIRAQYTLYLVLACLSCWYRSTALLEYWLLPLVCGQPVMWAQFIAQHTHTDLTDDPLCNGRAVTNGSTVYNFLSWNMPLHSVHHMYPRIPFFHLPAAYQLLQDDLKHRSNSFVGVHIEIIKKLTS